MDKEVLVEQILARVLEKMEAQRSESQPVVSASDSKKKLLFLSQGKGGSCEEFLRNPKFTDGFDLACTGTEEKACFDNVEALVLLDFTSSDMVKIASGISDTSYTATVTKALLEGVKVYVIRDQIEMFEYKERAPKPYYLMLKEKLKFLLECGLTIICRDKLEAALLGCELKTGAGIESPAPDREQSREEEREITISKRVITERDILEADREKVTCIRITERNILTDLAKDAAAQRNIRLLRQ